MLPFVSPLSSRAEALPSTGNERDGVHPSHPDTAHQSRQGLRPESPDQRASECWHFMYEAGLPLILISS